MRTLMSLVVVALVIPAPVGAGQAPPAQGKPAAPAQAPAAKPAAPAQAAPSAPALAPAQAKPAAPAAQQAKPNTPAPAAAPVEAAPPPPPAAAAASETYLYEPDGRRDPFLNLLSIDPNVNVNRSRPPGIAGLSVNEISVRGVIESRGGYVAMVQGPDNKTYSIHTGDRLFDGLVRVVNAEGLVVVQEVNDPLSLVKQREVSKKLRSLEAKE